MRQEKQAVHIPIDAVILNGNLAVPEEVRSVIIFAHGSGSSRLSPRNNFVAKVLHEAGLGTLLFDLLTEEEDTIYENRFNTDLLTERLEIATRWLQKKYAFEKYNIGYFGASTGAAAAIKAAADLGNTIGAVVSRGGRPDLAKEALQLIQSPTLLIVGGNDDVVIQFNKEAYEQVKAEKKLHIIPNAGHLFEEPGTLEEVARLAAEWFNRYLIK